MKVLIIQLLMTLFFLGFLSKSEFDESEILEFQASLKTVQAFVKADKERLVKVKKVTNIIDNYNPKMEMDLKQAITAEIYNMSVKYPNLDMWTN